MLDLVVPVILSGGAGTRLWPLSRRAYPKPFMRLPDGQTLLEKTVRRAARIATPDAPILTVTARDHAFMTLDAYAQVAFDVPLQHRLLLEPSARNTAAAVLLAALDASTRHGERVNLVILPADHWVDDLEGFSRSVRHAVALAQQGYLVTFGIRPTRPEVGYGYLRQGEAVGTDGFLVSRFVEKPDVATARAYLESGQFWWNSGMFCFAAQTMLEAAAQTCPDLLESVRAAYGHMRCNGGACEFRDADFSRIPEISIDYAVMERTPRCAMVPAQFAWSDIGSWTALAAQVPADARGNRTVGDAVLLDSHDTYVQAQGRLVAVVGVNDLAIIETPDAVLVAHRDSVQDVKRVVERLRDRQHEAADCHRTVHRPWGSYTVLEDAADCKVKRLTVKPGHVLSLQVHQRRSEHWTVVMGTAKVRVGDREFLLQRNESTFIPMGTLHRLENATQTDLHLIETQCGDYFGEDDILRLEDRYGRVPQPE